jgi:hypothetical protein
MRSADDDVLLLRLGRRRGMVAATHEGGTAEPDPVDAEGVQGYAIGRPAVTDAEKARATS